MNLFRGPAFAMSKTCLKFLDAGFEVRDSPFVAGVLGAGNES
jgi:hypothetical protein